MAQLRELAKLPPPLWRVKTQSDSVCEKLANAVSVDAVIAQILINRGVRSVQAARHVLDIQNLPAVYFPDTWVQKATAILQKLPAGSTVLLYGDYDVDGITSTSVMIRVLSALGFKPKYYIPDRFNDGYGLTDRVYSLVQDWGPAALITLDCGVTNVTECAWLKKQYPALSIIVVDHHQVPDPQPNVDLIVDPKLLPANHGYFDLCTVGIVYHFFNQVFDHMHQASPLKNDLDLVAIGTVADVAQLSPVNRALVRNGLAHMQHSKRPGLCALMRAAGLEPGKPVTSRDIGFGLAPLLNAAGRLANATMCVELMTAEDMDTADALANKLKRLNQERRTLTQTTMDEAIAYLESNPEIETHSVLVVSGRNWHPGVIGIVAARITDRYHRPSLVIGYNDTEARGSARSVECVNVYQLIKANAQYLTKFGGHHQAAGFSLKTSQLSGFNAAMSAHASTVLSANDLRPVIVIDAELPSDRINSDFYNQLHCLAPFGPNNSEPIFVATLRVIESRVLKDKHLKVRLYDDATRVVVDGIGFDLADRLPAVQKAYCSVVFHLQTNTWQGRTSMQLMIKDIR
ncbi:single-stranded-DNA-specific exonuclease RecJ [bacterium]|nr:single-stranded-DNA-specific exonuclease RecJ [bacterium]